MASISNYFVSVVVPLKNDADILEDFVEDVAELLAQTYQNYELVLVDDGSEDATQVLIDRLLGRRQCIRYLRLSRSFGPEVAIMAGLDVVIGDVVVTMQAESDPPSLIPRLVDEALEAKGIVFGLRTRVLGESFLYSLGRRLFVGLMRRMLRVDLPQTATLFIAFTRQTLNAVIRIKDKSRALRLFGLLVGFPHERVEYEPVLRRGLARRKGLIEGCERAVGLIVTNSMRPLRVVSYLGLAASLLNVLYIVYVFGIYAFKEDVAAGWVTTSLQNSGMFLFLFVILSVLCEYVGRLLTETRDRPLYFVAEERSSSVMIADEERRNVVHEATE